MNCRTRTHVFSSLAVLAAASTVAVAAPKPDQNREPMSIQQRQALSQSMATKNHNFSTPRTMAQAEATERRLPSGAMSIQVPEELWSHLAVREDAQGNLRQIEYSGDTVPVDATEGLDNE